MAQDRSDVSDRKRTLPAPARSAGRTTRPPASATTIGATPGKLTAADQAIIQELCDEGQVAYADMGSRLLAFGRLVFRLVFANDSAAALAVDRSKHPLWVELKRVAGGQRLRLDAKTVSVAVRLAAWDQAINDDDFRALDWGRKQLLLPLADGGRMREAAQHVLAMKLDHDATQRYVNARREEAGEPAGSRLTPGRAGQHVERLTEKLTAKRALPRLVATCATLDPAAKKALREKVAKELAALRTLEDALDD